MDKERVRVKEKMRFKDFVKNESIIDIPRQTYAPAVFDDADTKNPKIKESVLKQINDQVKEFKEYPVIKIALIGSILTKRYRNDADLDINVLFDVPKEKQEQERVDLSQKYLSAKNPNNIQGKLIPDSKHPINYYFITDQATYDDQNKKADAVFDIQANKFIKRPDDFTFDMNLYLKDFERKVQELDVIKGELKRDIIDYNELIELKPNEILDLQEKIKDKLEEIEDSIEDIVKIGDGVDAERRAAFNTDMTPDQIRAYGIKNRLPKNVIYKMLEKYHYLKFYKKCKKILEDGIVTDKEVKDLEIHEARDKSIAFTFGRFNPPTIGHEKLIRKVLSTPGNVKKIYLSRSQDSKKNPLSPDVKFRTMRDMFKYARPNLEIVATNMILDLMTKLHKTGFTDITMVVGSDRVREFEGILNKYNGESNRHGFYDFKSIKVVSAGERDPDAEGTTGMSASKMRDAAAKNDKESFKKGLPASYRNPADVDRLMSNVRVGMGIKTKLAASYGGMINVDNKKPVASLQEFEQNQIRDLYVREIIFNINDKIKYVKEDIQGIVKRRGTNYIVLEDNNNNLHKAWIWDCIPEAANREAEVREYNLNIDYGFKAVSTMEEDKTPQDKTVAKKPGTQPKKYYKDLSKGEKDKRADHFAKQKYKKSDDEDDYKTAPGDKDAKTKPSKHTLKYKKMFGEFKKELSDACWKGYKQVGMKKKGDRQVPNCVPESYEIGADYANHTKEVTPGQVPAGKAVDAKDRGKPEDNIKKKDIEEWALSDATIDKYRQRYREEWRSKLSEVVQRMMEKIDG